MSVRKGREVADYLFEKISPAERAAWNNKPDKPTAPPGNLLAAGEGGVLVDSGILTEKVMLDILDPVAGNLLSMDAQGKAADSGLLAANAMSKLEEPIVGNLVVQTEDGGLADGGVTVESIISQGLVNDNLLINGDFQIWQRGSSYSETSIAGGYVSADRWKLVHYSANMGGLCSLRKTQEGAELRLLSAFSDPLQRRPLWYHMEENDLKKIRGKAVTASCKIRLLTMGTSATITVFGQTVLVNSTEFKEYQITATVPVGAKESSPTVEVSLSGSTMATGDGVEVAWVKLEMGERATQYVSRPYGDELAMCKRYYEKIGFIPSGLALDTKQITCPINFENKRVVPTIKTEQGVTSVTFAEHASWATTHAGSPSFLFVGASVNCGAVVYSGFTGLTLNRNYFCRDAKLNIDAEV